MRDATIIGDTVNTAFRLEGLMKELNQNLVLSQDFVTVLPPRYEFVEFGEFQLKGKSQVGLFRRLTNKGAHYSRSFLPSNQNEPINPAIVHKPSDR